MAEAGATARTARAPRSAAATTGPAPAATTDSAWPEVSLRASKTGGETGTSTWEESGKERCCGTKTRSARRGATMTAPMAWETRPLRRSGRKLFCMAMTVLYPDPELIVRVGSFDHGSHGFSRILLNDAGAPFEATKERQQGADHPCDVGIFQGCRVGGCGMISARKAHRECGRLSSE